MEYKQLYVQSGSLVFLNSFPFAVAMGQPTKEVFGGTLTPLVGFCKKNSGHYYYEKTVLEDLAQKALKKLSTDYKKIYSNFKLSCEKLEELSWQAQTSPLEPNKGFETMWKEFIEFWKWSVFIDSFDTGTDFNEINRIASENNLTREEMQILTTPTELSYLQKFELTAVEKSATELVREFFWFNSSYLGTAPFTMKNAQAEIDKRKNMKEQIKSETTSYVNSLQEKQEKILKSKNLAENPLQLFNNLVTWRDGRKRFNFTGLHGLDIYARELVRSAGIVEEFYQVVTPFECIDNRFPSQSELEMRWNIGAVFEAFENNVEIVTGKKAVNIFNSLQSKRLDKRFDLRGQPACLGRVSGKVIVVRSVEDFASFEEGAILVTAMTRPEFVPIMKKAAGIITDEGGVTCHAAIVSRELNKPCIIGTQNASKVLKTGDVVELDAFHGLIKKL